MIGAAVPAAEIQSIDTSQAEALPGVKAVWTTDSRIVRFAGQDVAAVAAVSPDVARDAARLVKVNYKERPFTRELREAMPAGHAAGLQPRPAAGRARHGQERQHRRTAHQPREPWRRREGICRSRGGPRGDVLLPRAHPRAARDARRRGLLGGRRAHDLRLDPGDLRGARGSRRGARRRPQARARDLRAHGRRLRQQARALGHRQRLLGGGVPPRQAGRRSGQADARPPAGAPVHRQRAERAHEGEARGQEGRNAHRGALPVLGLGRGRRAAPAPRVRPARSTARTRTSRPRSRDIFTNPGPAAPLRATGHSPGADRDRVGDGRARGQARNRPRRAPEEERSGPRCGWRSTTSAPRRSAGSAATRRPSDMSTGAWGECRGDEGHGLGGATDSLRRDAGGGRGGRGAASPTTREAPTGLRMANGGSVASSPPRERTPQCQVHHQRRLGRGDRRGIKTSAPASGRR